MAEPDYGATNIGLPIGFDYGHANIHCMETESHGARIKRLRKARGWTQKDLQEAARVDQSTLSGIEKHNAMPSGETLIRLADALETQAEYIMRGATKDWPFESVSFERWVALGEKDRGYVEGRLDEAIKTCEGRQTGALEQLSIGTLAGKHKVEAKKSPRSR